MSPYEALLAQYVALCKAPQSLVKGIPLPHGAHSVGFLLGEGAGFLGEPVGIAEVAAEVARGAFMR